MHDLVRKKLFLGANYIGKTRQTAKKYAKPFL